MFSNLTPRGCLKIALKLKRYKIDGKGGSRGCMGNDRNSFGKTDRDATLMLMKKGSLGIGYNIQMATENQVIVGFGVYQKPNDNLYYSQ